MTYSSALYAHPNQTLENAQEAKLKGKLLSASRHRACDHVMTELCISEGRACRALGQHRSTQRKIPTAPDDAVALTADIIELARQSAMGIAGLLSLASAARRSNRTRHFVGYKA